MRYYSSIIDIFVLCVWQLDIYIHCELIIINLVTICHHTKLILYLNFLSLIIMRERESTHASEGGQKER